jgi:hypothetical protein
VASKSPHLKLLDYRPAYGVRIMFKHEVSGAEYMSGAATISRSDWIEEAGWAVNRRSRVF